MHSVEEHRLEAHPNEIHMQDATDSHTQSGAWEHLQVLLDQTTDLNEWRSRPDLSLGEITRSLGEVVGSPDSGRF